VTLPGLTEPERRLWEAFPRGSWLDLRTGDRAADDPAGGPAWDEARVIRAGVIRALLLGAGKPEPGYTSAVRLRGARIEGRLDLMGATVGSPLVCEYCYFGDEPRFVESSARTIRLVHSRLPGFNGTRMRLDGILNFWCSAVTGVLRLDQTKITGQLCLTDASIGAPGGAEAVAASGLTVDGGAECMRLRTSGSFTARAAAITGTVDLSDAQLSCPGGRALDIDHATIGGKLDCGGLAAEGETRMHNCRVTASIAMPGARLANPSGIAFSAGGLTAGGGVFLHRGFTASGEIRLVGAQFAANLSLSGATLRNPGGLAINLDRAAIGVCHADGFRCEGQLSLVGARIGGPLSLPGAVLTGPPGEPALNAENISVDGALNLTGVRASGELNLRTARIGQRLLLEGSELASPDGHALRLSRAQIAADVFCDGMVTTGNVRLSGAVIAGTLSFRGARLGSTGGVALYALRLQAGMLILAPEPPLAGTVDLRHAQLGILRDDPACWPGRLSLDGLVYQALEPRLPARQRLRWLARDPGGHQPQPYEQLAAHYRAIGDPAQARLVLHARERAQRPAKPPLGRAWSLLQDLTVGYGYQPWRALSWLAVLLLVGSIVYAARPPPALQPGAAPHFSPFVYTLDLLLPVVDLGQKHAFNPAGPQQWLSYLLIAAGWILVTTVAAGAARILSRG
jgi:hypothetical protein